MMLAAAWGGCGCVGEHKVAALVRVKIGWQGVAEVEKPVD